MNIHPLIVHFPVALLVVYTFLEVLSVHPACNGARVRFTRGLLAVFGALAALVALPTGEVAEHMIEASQGQQLAPLVETHAMWATVAAWIFIVLGAAYLVQFAKEEWGWPKATWPQWMQKISLLKQRVATCLLRTYIRVPLAIVGFVALSVAGALGAAIVHGPDADFMVSFVYGLFF